MKIYVLEKNGYMDIYIYMKYISRKVLTFLFWEKLKYQSVHTHVK